MSLPVLRTNRLLLRPWTSEDVDSLHALWTAPEVRRYLWDDIVITREVAENLVKSNLESAAQHRIGYWAINAPHEPQLAGFSGFRIIDDGPEIELLYGLKGEHRGKGFATEASLAAIAYLWRSTEFQQVFARTDPPNEASVRVMVRLGMTHLSTTPSTITYVLRR
jgi:[ribosomal protein S5]-alanine N-acetyltransferase